MTRAIGRAAGWLRRQPVRLRIAFVSAALTAAILIGFAVVVGRLASDRLRDDFREDVVGSATVLASNITMVRDENGFPEPAGRVNLDSIAMSNDAAIRIVDEVGEPVYPSNAPDLGAPSTDGELRDSIGTLKVADRPIAGLVTGGPVYVQYALSSASTDATIDRLWIFLASGVVVGTLLSGFAGMAVAGRTMSPIARLTSAARSIAITRDPSTRIPEIRSDDEVAELARTLDQMLRELDAARSEAEATVSRQREFVADASHELRTPLTSILANLEMLEESLAEEATDDDRAAARSALRSSRRMSRLVTDLLTLARADAGRFGKPVRCDLARVTREAFEEVSPVADEHDLDATLTDAAELEGNPDELHRMVVNLLENAIKHTPRDSRIELTMERSGGSAVICVDDDGPGLPEGLEGAIFERFVRGAGPADRVNRDDGTGLGLSIVRAVAETHSGSVEAGESPLGGARFRVEIPLADDITVETPSPGRRVVGGVAKD